MPDLVLATRGSLLARTQSEQVAAALRAAHPGLTVEPRIVTTAGDRDTTTPLPAIGGKGLFTAELEAALLDGTADLAVHSLKDLPTEQPAGLALGCVPARQAAWDALCLPERAMLTSDRAAELLTPGLRLGTSSTRRAAMLRQRRPDLCVEPLRGNLDSRFRKLDEGRYDAILLAAAGLYRLSWEARISAEMPTEWLVPAPGQGALGIQCRADDGRVAELLAPLDDPVTRAAVTAERAFLAALGGGCQTPLGAYAEPVGEGLRLRVALLSTDATERIDREAVAPLAEAESLGEGLARALLAEGADRLLAAG